MSTWANVSNAMLPMYEIFKRVTQDGSLLLVYGAVEKVLLTLAFHIETLRLTDFFCFQGNAANQDWG